MFESKNNHNFILNQDTFNNHENQAEQEIDGIQDGLNESVANDETSTDDFSKPLSHEELAKGEELQGKTQEEFQILIPVPEDAEPFDQESTSRLNQHFGFYPTVFYDYHTSEGGLIGYIVRWDIPQKDGTIEKEIRPYVYVQYSTGYREWKCKGFPNPRPLYKLHELFERPDDIVLICEGEKATEAGAHLFPCYVTTTSPHGAKSIAQADWSSLKGRDVIICPDFDDPGQKWAEELTNICQKVGVKSIRYLFPEIFHLLRIPYFEKIRKQTEGIFPRISVEKMFDNKDDIEDVQIEEIICPADIEHISQYVSQDVALIMEDACLFSYTDIDNMPYDTQRIPPQGYDLADAQKEGWTPQLIKALIGSLPDENKLFSGVLCSQLKPIKTEAGQYILKPAGVFWEDKKICAFLNPIASCRTLNGDQWTLLVEFIDKDFKKREIFIPNKLLPKDGSALSELLIDSGLWINVDPKAGRQNLKYYLNQTPKERMVLVNKIGWHGQNYVFPDKAWGKPEREKHKLYIQGTMPIYEEIGTIDQWTQEIGKYLQGNSRLIFGVSMGLASSLLTPLGRQNFGVHYIGYSSIGKSTILYVVASIFGAEVKSWRTTDNCAEAWAREANDNIFFLDELGKAPNASVVSEMLYMLGDGQGKGRANRFGDARDVTKFKTYPQSTGEMSFEDKMRQGFGKRNFFAGQSVRLAQIQADAGQGMGIYENLHGFKNGALLSDHLVKSSLKYRGTLGDAWLSYCCQNYNDVLKKAECYAQIWMDKYPLENGTDGQVIRVKGHFAHIAAIGEMAIEQKLLPLKSGDVYEAVAILFNDWLNQRGGVESHEDMEVVQKLISFIEEHGSSRFENPWNAGEDEQTGRERPNNEKVFDRAGFRKFVDEQYTYYFLSTVFTRDILDGAKGASQKARLKKLADSGYIQTTTEKKEGKDMNRYSKTERIPSHGVKKVYVVRMPAE